MAYSLAPVSIDAAIKYCPALMAGPAAHTSGKYEHIPTIDVLTALGREGFNIHGIHSINARTNERRLVGKHMIRLRKGTELAQVGEEFPEVLLVNSHDGTCAYKMSAGLVRLVCKNGMVVSGPQFTSVSVRHQGRQTIDQVIEGTYQVIEDFPKIRDQVENMKALTLNRDEQRVLASAALMLRYPDEEDKVQVSPDRILRAQRFEDRKDDLWTTFNRVQEAVIRGGAQGYKRDENGNVRRSTMRPVTSIDGDVNLNRALWSLGQEMARLKSAA